VDPAVALIQAYLQLNGYFTVAEFPVVTPAAEDVETITDVDLIAIRFPLAQPLGAGPAHAARPDSVLRVSDDAMDLLICEVKEGKAHINPNLNRADTLRATLERIGCCAPDHVGHHVEALLRHGMAEIEHPGRTRCRARIAVFAGRPGDPRRAPVVISLEHAARQVSRFLQQHREALHAMRLTQPALAHLHLLDKLGMLAKPARAQSEQVT
jgi:hypothetical protein